MENSEEKVILFPKWKTRLEEESLAALKDKRYEEALKKLNELISYNISSHEIIIGKLICLMELNRHDEAQNLCEDVLAVKDNDYYKYLHIYLTILFQTNQYELLMENVEYELSSNKIPAPMRQQFKQLYEMSAKLEQDSNQELMNEYMQDFLNAVDLHDYHSQWRYIKLMQHKKLTPNHKIIGLLIEESVHPVIKTTIFQWLQQKNWDKAVEMTKFGLHIHINPSSTVELENHHFMQQFGNLLNETEQKNPTLFNMIKDILYRYTFVRYPFLPSNDEVESIARAITYIAERNLNLHNESEFEELNDIIEEIETCEKLFLSVVDEL
ncbi:tetratricopeptide repeat protein [Ornithinibacillus halophilus]|uniref:Tetratricopeptide repeat-containing protein n=1 Tax=Ornithinibacillus halophilus TaxID=930117 RepID=A0A1M5JCP2_9BACI|nr:tetratricopeptide repeat protein [Ornithinibacillus halophilus]SHG38030.1 hypothetical protein SAMN05216225_102927 [Ornithinibacillus halophilus]